MRTELIFAACVCCFLSSCTSGEKRYSEPTEDDRVRVCKGLGCGNVHKPANNSVIPEVHKPTKEERLRVQQGLPPDFGSDELSVGGTFPW